jgi:DNA (cytosine-5)-methyltransferase 1
MIENVPGLMADKSFKTFCASLNKNGYKVEFKVLDAADYGVPQRRRRLILLASKQELIEFAKPAKVMRTVRNAIGSLPRPTSKKNQLHGISLKRSVKIKELIKKIPKDGGSRTDLPEKDQLKCHKKCNGFKDVYGRMNWDEVAPTITGGCINPSKGRFLHPTQNRSITLREAALLQSFPRGYKFSMNKGRYPVAQMIGNALPPEFIRRHASMIFNHLNKPVDHKTRSKVLARV